MGKFLPPTSSAKVRSLLQEALADGKFTIKDLSLILDCSRVTIYAILQDESKRIKTAYLEGLREIAARLGKDFKYLAASSKQASDLNNVVRALRKDPMPRIKRKLARHISALVSEHMLQTYSISVVAGIQIMRKLADKELNSNVIFVASTQEEVGLRGARTSAYK